MSDREAVKRLSDAKNFVSLGYTHSALMAIDDAIKILKAAQAQAQSVNQQLLEALEAAIKFIDSHVADPDITQEMRENYAALQKTNPYDAIAAAQEGK